jgi:glycerophosphoryl diester phosphodiesterase
MKIRFWPLAVIACLTLLTSALSAAEPKPLASAHAHNDYEHARPLSDALEHGFCSVEADVWLVGAQLLVAHDRTNIIAGHTLQKLYLDPLRERARTNAGRIFSSGPSLTLLIDVKSDATNTWLVLRKVLRDYELLLTRFRDDRTETNAVTVIISGNRARGLMEKDVNRLAGYDGRLEDLESGATAGFIPLVSDNWRRLSSWRGTGPLPPEDERKLRDAVAKAHAQGRRIRFWGASDTPEVWAAFRKAGVDLLNADNLDGLKEFLLNDGRK